MSFIAKNPISAAQITSPPPVPPKGTRGIFAKEDGWYDIDASGNIKKLGAEITDRAAEADHADYADRAAEADHAYYASKAEKLYMEGDIELSTDEHGNVYIIKHNGDGTYEECLLYDPYLNDIRADRDSAGRTIADTYATKEELQAPKDVIEFIQGIRFVVDEDGLWVIREGDGYTEKKLLYNSLLDLFQVDYASESATAGQASEDSSGNYIIDTYATKEELKAPKKVIEFSNGVKIIKSKETPSGLSLSYGGNESLIYDGESNLTIVEQSLYAESAICDNAGNQIVETYATKEELENSSVAIIDKFDDEVIDMELINNAVVYFGEVSSINVSEGTLDLGFSMALHFQTPTELSSDYSNFPAFVYFKGDSTNEGYFVPEPNMNYTVVFDMQGSIVVGYVSGVSR